MQNMYFHLSPFVVVNYFLSYIVDIHTENGRIDTVIELLKYGAFIKDCGTTFRCTALDVLSSPDKLKMFRDKDLIPSVTALSGSIPPLLSFDHHHLWFTAVNHQIMNDGVAYVVVEYLTGHIPSLTLTTPNLTQLVLINTII